MTIPKKGSRTIEVAGDKYRWTISHKVDEGFCGDLRDGSKYFTVIIEKIEAQGCIAKAVVRLPNPEFIVTSKQVFQIISHAKENKWKPEDAKIGTFYVGMDRMYDEYESIDLSLSKKYWPKNW